MKIILRITSILALLLFSVSCASVSNRAEIPHPPAYKDFLKLQSSDYEEMGEDFFLRRINLLMCISPCDKTDEAIDDKKAAEIKLKCIKDESDERIVDEMAQNLQFKKAIQFTQEELNTFRHSQNSRAIVGAGIQSDIDGALGTELLEAASTRESSAGLALVSLIDRYIALQPKETDEGSLPTNLQSSIMKLLKTDPDNALSHYLAGYKLHLDKEDNESLLQLKEGNTKGRFTSYSTERFFAVVEAAESIGYPKFTARQHALTFFIPNEIYSTLFQLCKSLLKEDNKGDVGRECLRTGEKIEYAGHNASERLNGLIIQSIALSQSSDPEDIKRLAQISNKQKDVLKTGPQLLKLPFREIPETVWLQYFEIFFTKDEESAVTFLVDYHNKTKQANGK